MSDQKFQRLRELYGEVADLSFTMALMHWDQQTQMPPRASAARASQMATLSSLIHEKMVAPELGDLVGELQAGGEKHSEIDRAFLRELAYQRERQLKLPAPLVHEFAQARAEGFDVWRRARQEKKFATFAPALRRLVALTFQAAECWGYEGTPWNALVPDYERGMTAERLEEILSPLRDATVRLLEKILAAPRVDTSFLDQKWDIPRQREFGARVAADLGYDFSAGRLDIAPHPFSTTLGYGDSRITTRYSEESALDSLTAIIHEAGHSMYEQGFPQELARTPLFDAPSLGLHESQSRFWEVRIGCTQAFWRHYLPVMKQYFPGQLEGVDTWKFYRALNRVQPDFLRVESDEVCYNLHVILRFEIEQMIFAGNLAVDDLPEAWNEKVKSYFGLDVPDDAKGCLQDIHWSDASFGYFPTYSLGNIYNAMFVEKMEQDLPEMWEDVSRGRFEAILTWLREKIHRHGSVYHAPDLVEQVSGKPLSCEALVRYLESKYGEIYGL